MDTVVGGSTAVEDSGNADDPMYSGSYMKEHCCRLMFRENYRQIACYVSKIHFTVFFIMTSHPFNANHEVMALYRYFRERNH